MFRSINQSLHPLGSMPWVILCLWVFLYVKDAGRRGNNITALPFYPHPWQNIHSQNYCVALLPNLVKQVKFLQLQGSHQLFFHRDEMVGEVVVKYFTTGAIQWMPKCVTLSGNKFLWMYCKLLDNATSKNLCTKLCVNWFKWCFPFTYYNLARKCIIDTARLTGPSAPTALKAAIPRTEKARLTLLPLIVGSFRGSENQTVMHYICHSSEWSSLKPIHQSQFSVLK